MVEREGTLSVVNLHFRQPRAKKFSFAPPAPLAQHCTARAPKRGSYRIVNSNSPGRALKKALHEGSRLRTLVASTHGARCSLMMTRRFPQIECPSAIGQ